MLFRMESRKLIILLNKSIEITVVFQGQSRSNMEWLLAQFKEGGQSLSAADTKRSDPVAGPAADHFTD